MRILFTFIITALCGAAACNDSTGPRSDFLVTPVKAAFTSSDGEVAVIVTNQSEVNLYIADYSEFELREPTRWRQLSVSECELPGPPGWHAVGAGKSVTCRHPIASGYPPGDYRLNVAVLRDTTVHTGLTASPTFQILP
jgi:hypothetical protein